jgi:hypothetical protein
MRNVLFLGYYTLKPRYSATPPTTNIGVKTECYGKKMYFIFGCTFIR